MVLGPKLFPPPELAKWDWQKEGCARRRSLELERIARQADAHTRRGFELAGRRAYFSARAEFISALRLIAEGLDKEQRSGVHTQALAHGLLALKEAEDFLPSGEAVGPTGDLRVIVAGHETPVLKDRSLNILTSTEALQRYFTYAQEQLALAAGQEVAGSMALYGLGKLYTAMADQPALGLKAPQSKAMVFYQAALLVDPTNYMAANDLGVLLARNGWYEEAKAALGYSIQIYSHPVAWRNLAIVCRQLGEEELAVLAARQWRLLQQPAQGLSQQNQTADLLIQWVSPERFAATTTEPSPGFGRPEQTESNQEGSSFPAPSEHFFGIRREDGPSTHRVGTKEDFPASGSVEGGPFLFDHAILRSPFTIFRKLIGSLPSARGASAAWGDSSHPAPPNR